MEGLKRNDRVRKWQSAGQGRATVWGLSLLALIISGVFPLHADEPKPAERVAPRMIVPAYFYPAGAGLKLWERLIASPIPKSLIVIVNPASGPGKEVSQDYRNVVPRATEKGLTLIGYVSTSYAKRNLAEVKADVDTWLTLYPEITGVFFDEQASGAEHVPYYAELYQYARQEKNLSLVVTNPGTVCAEEYFTKPATDVACLFEGLHGRDVLKFPQSMQKYAARCYVLPYAVKSSNQMRDCFQETLGRNFGYRYITDRKGENPWDGLPVWWDELTELVRKETARRNK